MIQLQRKSFWFRSLLASALGGVALGVFVGTPSFFILYCLLLVSSACVVLCWKHIRIRWIVCVFFFFCLGFFRMSGITTHSDTFSSTLIDSKKSISFKGAIVNDPFYKKKGQQIHIALSSYQTQEGQTQLYKGELRVIARLYPLYAKGDIVWGTCTPRFFQSKKILPFQKKSTQDVVCLYPSIKKIGHVQESFFVSSLSQFRSWITRRLSEVLSTQVAGFVAGILFGSQDGISQDMQQAFVKTGTSHLLAVSGYNISLVIMACFMLLRTRGVSRKKSGGVVLISIVLFTLFTGSSPATVRACIMGSAILIAQMIGRQRSGLAILLFTGAGMIFFDPHLLLFNHSFYLSFLATLGIVIGTTQGSSVATDTFSLRKYSTELFFQSFFAMLFTAPYIFYFFGNFSVIGIIANMIIVPLIPFCMAIGFLLSVALCVNVLVVNHLFFIISFLAGICESVIRAVLSIIFFFSRIPYASLSFPLSLESWIGIYCMYSMLGFWVWWRHHEYIHKFKEEIVKLRVE